jgi:hypothetical protein
LGTAEQAVVDVAGDGVQHVGAGTKASSLVVGLHAVSDDEHGARRGGGNVAPVGGQMAAMVGEESGEQRRYDAVLDISKLSPRGRRSGIKRVRW